MVVNNIPFYRVVTNKNESQYTWYASNDAKTLSVSEMSYSHKLENFKPSTFAYQPNYHDTHFKVVVNVEQ
jgi:hypothetical protein